MATLIPAPIADDATSVAGELAVLAPDRTLELGGRSVTIREYGFFEGLDVADRASALLDDLVAATEDGNLRYAQVRRLFGRHRAVVPAIAAQAADVEVAWLEALAPGEQELFMATWFATNSAFFVREVLAEMREAQLLAAGASAGSSASPGSPLPDSAPPSSLADAPSAS
jgi:hypothetical protein